MNSELLYLALARFEAACRLPGLAAGHPAGRLHGHSYLARLRAGPETVDAGFSGAAADALQTRLQGLIAPLDYSYLNDHIDFPSDENISRWLADRLPSGVVVGIQSTRNTGVDLAADGHAHIWHRFRFEAAHQLPNVPAGHQCGRMHGHGFEVVVHVDQQLASGQQMGLDYAAIEAAWQPLHEQLDHACLNEIKGLENPTSEVLASWIWERLVNTVPGLSWVSVYETASAGCHYDGHHYRIWKEFRFESALSLPAAPPGDPRHRLHGHSYLLRLHLGAPLDQVMGWTIDYGDVKSRFRPVCDRLDHQRLNQCLDNPALEGLLAWIREQARPALPQLERIDLYQTRGCGAMLSWGEQAPALPS